MIHFLHQQTDELLGHLDGHGERAYWDDEQKQEVGGLNVLSFTMPSGIAEAEFANERNRILVRHERGGWQEYIIYNTVTTESEIRVIATGSEIELNKLKIVTPQRRVANQLAQMLAVGVDGIDWELGNIIGAGTETRDFERHLGGYDYVKQVANTFDVELVFRTEVSGSRVVGRYIDAVQRTGDSKGKEFVAGKDIINIEREMFGDRIVTALYCVGPEPAEGETQLITLVTDDSAFQRWNRKGQHIIEVYELEDAQEDTTMNQLKAYGRKELNKRIAAVVEYKIDAADLSSLYPHEEAFLGDKVRVIDDEFVPPLYAEARIIGVTRPIISDTSVPIEKTYTIGEVFLRKKEDLMRNFKTIAERYSTKIIRSTTAPDGTPNVIWIQTDTGHGFDVAHLWTEEFGWVAITPQSAADIGADPAGSAEAALQQARSEINDVNMRVNDLEAGIDEAFRDGIIEEAEAIAIRKYINSLNAEKLDIDNGYTQVHGNPNLSGTPKTNLANAKTTLNTAHTALIGAINMAILDGKATPAEVSNVDTKFSDYRTALGAYSTALTQASDAISTKKAADAQAAAITAAATDATQKANAAQAAAQNFATAKAEAERVIAEAYADGIVDDEEAARIADVTAKLAEAKTYADAKKAEAIAAANTHANTAAANAQAAAISAANAKAEAERAIAEAYADGIVSDEEAARIAQANANLATAQAHANTAANNALAAANTYADAVRSDLTSSINSVNTALSNFETDVTGAFKDGIIEQAEAASIEKYKNALVAEKLDFDNRYTRIYADTSLTGTPKTNLLSAKNAYNTAHTNLINSINAAILDGKATAAERADVDAKFTLYRTALGTLVTRLEEAITATVNAKSAAAQANAIAAAATDAQNKATAARVAAEAVAVAEANAARIAAEAYADGIISDEEARAIAEAERVLEEARAHADMAAEALLDSENFRNALDTKLDTSALAGLVTKEELESLTHEVDGKIAAGIEGIDFSDYATNEALQDSVDDMKKGLSSTTGLNLLRNSVGYGGLKYWNHTTATQTVSTLRSESLSTLGYGAGFYFPSAGGDKGIQQTVRVEPGTEYTLSWFVNRATTGNFLISIYEDGQLKLTMPDTSLPNSQFQSSYIPYTAETGEITVRFTASAGVEATLTGIMLGLGNLPTQWTSANGELFNAYVRVDDDGLIVLRIDALGRVEGYTAMTPEEFAAYYDDNRDGQFEKVFWFNRDETVTKKLQAVKEITMGRIKIVRVEGTTNRGWAFVPTVPDNF